MQQQLVDFNFLEELAGGEPKYKYDVLEIFLGTVDEGLANLERLVTDMRDFEALYKQAHALKSPSGIVQVKDMHGRLGRLEELARAVYEKKSDTAGVKDEIIELFSRLKETYEQARPLLITERDKCKPEQ